MKIILSIWMVFFCLTIADGQTPSQLSFSEGNVYVTGVGSIGGATNSIHENEWKNILVVFTHEAWIKKLNQPIAGTWSLVDDNIIFMPHFPFSSGETYHAVFNRSAFHKYVHGKISSQDEKTELTFTLRSEEFMHTSIEAVYPMSTSVPENLLRMYICFSSPMMPGEAYRHIRLLHDDGSPVEKPFLIVDQELWDTERKRFTLLFDPGRIKRTLKSNLELGAPLKEDDTYQLVIDSAWRDVHGNPLQKNFKKQFTVSAAQRTKLAKKHVTVISPKPDSAEDVVISFDYPMDHVLTSKFLSVRSLSAGDIPGTIRMIDDRTWAFTPDHRLPGGPYEIQISPWVEDVCGNNFNNAFDLDLAQEKRVSSDELIKVMFLIKPLDQ